MDSNSNLNWRSYEMNNENFTNLLGEIMNQNRDHEVAVPAETLDCSKTEFVRRILNEIGAVSEKNPPEGWVLEVEKRLAQNNLKMHRNTIYFTRRNMLKSQGKKNANAKLSGKKKHFQNKPSEMSGSINYAATQPVFSANHISALRDVQKLAQKFGGLRHLSEAVEFLLSLKENRS